MTLERFPCTESKVVGSSCRDLRYTVRAFFPLVGAATRSTLLRIFPAKYLFSAILSV